MPGLHFEEFEVGAQFRHPWTRTVTILYCSMTMNAAPIHLDARYMERSFYGRRIVPSIYTAGLIGGMIVPDLTLGTTLGNLDYTRFDFPKPVLHGDTLRADSTILDKRELSFRTTAAAGTAAGASPGRPSLPRTCRRPPTPGRASRAQWRSCRAPRSTTRWS